MKRPYRARRTAPEPISEPLRGQVDGLNPTPWGRHRPASARYIAKPFRYGRSWFLHRSPKPSQFSRWPEPLSPRASLM